MKSSTKSGLVTPPRRASVDLLAAIIQSQYPAVRLATVINHAQPMHPAARRPYLEPNQRGDNPGETLSYVSDIQQKPLSPLIGEIQLLDQLRHTERSCGVARDELLVDTFSCGIRL